MKSINNSFWVGIVIIILPFLGLPSLWKTILFALIGLWLCFSSFSAQRRKQKNARSVGRKKEDSSGMAFMENQQPKTSPDILSADSGKEVITANYEENPRA